MKIKYENLHRDQLVHLRNEVTSEGKLIPAGTRIHIKSFPPKVRKIEKNDLNRKGYLRDYFCNAIRTSDNYPVRCNLFDIQEAWNKKTEG
jgi:hypothetical protein